LVLSLVVLVHEGGHFFIARRCGVMVEEFSLGFGKEICGWTDKKGTRWKVCYIPLGGYVKMLGDEDAAGAKSTVKKVPKKLQPYTFMAQKLWKRAAIIFAGPATNYVFAIVVLGLVIWLSGVGIWTAKIAEVEEGSAAEKAGLKSGDIFLSINDNEIKDFSDVQRAVRVTEYGKMLHIKYNRNGEVREVDFKAEYINDSEYPRLGVIASVDNIEEKKDVGFFEAFGIAINQCYTVTADTLSYLKQVLLNHRSPKEMRGPLGIAEASGDAFEGGPLILLIFIANISVAVGLMNLLPIPILDGGHLALYLIEAVRRKPLSEKVQNAIMWMGFSILMGLVCYTFVLDIPRIIKRIIE